MKVNKPEALELNKYYQSYLKYVEEDDLLTAFETQMIRTQTFLSEISEESSKFRYQPDKWQICEVIGHLCDTERILCYRALRFARKDKTPLAGFEENDYILNANFQSRSWKSIKEEKSAISQATLLFFSNLDPDTFSLTGIANNSTYSVRSLLFFIIAHERHHLQVIKDRYLKKY